MSTKTGGRAFPVPMVQSTFGPVSVVDAGMTLRDYFAAQVLPAVSSGNCIPNYVAHLSYQIADAMLAAREKPECLTVSTPSPST